MYQLFHLLRAGAEKIYVFAAAMHASFGHGRDIAAVVADHFVLSLVMSERDSAVLALERFPTGAAQHHRGIPAAIEQYHDLFLAFEPLFDLGSEFARNNLLAAGLLEFLAHVDNLDFRQGTALHAIGQVYQRVLIFLGVEIRFQRWRG